MRFGYWLPVFGGWLRNVEDEGMDASWGYVSRLARRSEELGFDLTLVAELNLNDIKGDDAPRPTIHAGGESSAAKALIARKCDAWLTHGDPPEVIAPKLDDMRARRETIGLPSMSFVCAVVDT
jgi:alkanesulfonate monooxygenase SsuD/methylene tetrahydromethanopterin reductase-like flavin-dependent oxidoreductase (luciferase family)